MSTTGISNSDVSKVMGAVMGPKAGIPDRVRRGTPWAVVFRAAARNAGFTLIELIVVIALMGIMLFFSLPRLQGNPFIDDANKSTRLLIGKISMLRENAVRNGRRYSLNLDLDVGRIWESSAAMTAEELEQAALNNSYTLPAGVRLVDVEFARKGKQNSGLAQITFYRTGYADKVLIHLQEDETYRSLLIEPFLSDVTVFEKYAGFDD
jgi:prepilin-type N-terminal cleavage/methylation domain-containing protein